MTGHGIKILNALGPGTRSSFEFVVAGPGKWDLASS